MWSIALMISLPGPLWPGVVARDRVLSMGQIELNCVTPMSVLDMTLNHLIVRLSSWRFGKCAVVWLISTSPLFSKTFSPFTNPLWIVRNAPVTIGITVTFMFYSFPKFLARSWYFSLFAFFFFFLLYSLPGRCKHTSQQALVFFLVDYHKVWYLQISDIFVRFMLQEIFWVVLMIKFQFLA